MCLNEHLYRLLKRQPIRIIFKHQDVLYKFLTIFVSEDNSFHFHLYEESNKEFEYYNLTKEKDGKSKIDINKPVNSNFLRHKFTFHKSGYIHSTDKNGKRFKDGIKGLAFNEIETSNLILMFAPKSIESLENTSIKKMDTISFLN